MKSRHACIGDEACVYGNARAHAPRLLVTVLAVVALLVVPLVAAAWPTSARAGNPPGPIYPPESTSTMYPSGAGASPLIVYSCSVDHGIQATQNLANSWVIIQQCYADGVPVAWTGTNATTKLQEYEHGIAQWVTIKTGTGYDSARANNSCVTGTAWRNQSSASAIVAGVPVSGGPWFNSENCTS
jgi:hypothetical protein